MIIRNSIAACAAPAARSGVAIVLIFLLLSVAPRRGLTASLQPIQDFGPNPGELNMHIYVPDGINSSSAIVVALHGCLLNASKLDDETGLTALADEFKLVLLFPEQREANDDNRCFNWFQVNDSRKGQGESGSIRNMIQYTLDAYQVDASKIFVLGLSTGGSMTAVLLANYPGLFQGGAIIAGTPYECNNPTWQTWSWWKWPKLWWGDAAAASDLLPNLPSFIS